MASYPLEEEEEEDERYAGSPPPSERAIAQEEEDVASTTKEGGALNGSYEAGAGRCGNGWTMEVSLASRPGVPFVALIRDSPSPSSCSRRGRRDQCWEVRWRGRQHRDRCRGQVSFMSLLFFARPLEDLTSLFFCPLFVTF